MPRDQPRRRHPARRRGRRGLAAVGVLAVVGLILVASVGGQSRGSDPVTSVALTRYLSTRQGRVSVTVYDVSTHTEWGLHPTTQEQTASIEKADILATLLYQAQQRHRQLSDATSDAAQGMIEYSSNTDASTLWDAVGARPGVLRFNARAGLRDTAPGRDGYWGETETTTADQITLLEQLLPSGTLLNAASKAYELGLMENVEPGENWGVSGGVPAKGVTVALKNGWVTLTSNTDWEVNSIGWIRGDGHDYLIAVTTAHDPSEQYGIDTISHVSAAVYDALGPVPAAGTRTVAEGITPED